MGHLHIDAIRKLAQKEMVNGLTILSKNHNHVCEGCVLGKSHDLPVPEASQTMYKHMELVVIDLAGPMFIETWSGMSYVFMAVEASTQMGVAELMVSKDETPELLKATVAKLERQSGIKLKQTRSDNGTEFVNNIVHSFCRRNGIIHETTILYIPKQNGIAESAIRVRFEMVRCMLHSAGMDLQYWGEACMYTVHICNLSPTSAIQDNVPLHVWSR
jgi:hypothetical protein